MGTDTAADQEEFSGSPPPVDSPAAVRAQPVDPLLDAIAPVHLQELRSMRDLLPALRDTFRTSVALNIELIREAINAEDPIALARSAHGLVGAAGSVGGLRLVRICRELEQLGRAKTVDGSAALLNAAEVEYDNLCNALSYIAELSETSQAQI